MGSAHQEITEYLAIRELFCVTFRARLAFLLNSSL